MNSLIPAPIARQPWQMLLPLIVLVCFGAAVLYSAAGGHFQPYAVSHLVRFAIFVAMASVMTLFNKDVVRFVAYPLYGLILALLLGGSSCLVSSAAAASDGSTSGRSCSSLPS